MNKIEWKEEYCTNVKIIDDQHHNFIMKLNILLTITPDKQPDKFSAELSLLVDEIKIHFDTENNFMKKYKYLGYFSHKSEHDRFLKKLSDIIENIENNDKNITEELIYSFYKWFINHLEINDRKLAIFLNSLNIY